MDKMNSYETGKKRVELDELLAEYRQLIEKAEVLKRAIEMSEKKILNFSFPYNSPED